MPSASESMIAGQVMGKINEVTVPYSPGSLEGLNSRFSYVRPQDSKYDGIKSMADRVIHDMKYGGRLSERYGSPGAGDKVGAENLYQGIIRNALSPRPDTSLYQNLMSGYNLN